MDSELIKYLKYRYEMKNSNRKCDACGDDLGLEPHKCSGKGKYEQLGAEIGKIVTDKQISYGDSFGNAGRVMEIIYPNGITREQYDDALVVVRIIDKLFRIANRKNAYGESPYGDIAGYSLLGLSRDNGKTHD